MTEKSQGIILTRERSHTPLTPASDSVEMGAPFSKPIPKLPEPTLPRSSSTPPQHESSDIVKRESAECRAFQRCFADLAGGILNPSWLAIQLYSRKLIGPDLRTEAQKEAIEERVKIEKLLLAVENQIVASPATVFSEFLGILQKEPSLEDLATKLKNAHRELVSKPSLTSTLSSPPVDTYTFYLKSVYAREQLPIYDKCPQVKSKNYINLALVEKQDITKREADEFVRTTIHGNIDDINKSKRAICIGRIRTTARWITAEVHCCRRGTWGGEIYLSLETVS